MVPLRVVFAERAGRDLEDIVDYIAADSPAGAERVYRAIMEASDRLAQFPNLGRPGRLVGMRELSVAGIPYILAYEADAAAVTILAVFHTSRDLPRALAERSGRPGA